MSNMILWNDLWKNSVIPAWDPISEEILTSLVHESKHPENLKWLEAGAGSGKISAKLAKMGANVTLIDYSPAAVELQKRVFIEENIEGSFALGNIRNTPYDNHTFDIVWSSGVLEHFDLDEQVSILKEFKRITKPCGLIITIVPYAGSPFYLLGKWWAERTGSWQYGYEVPVLSLQEHAKVLGLESVREYTIASKESLAFLSQIPGSGNIQNALQLTASIEPSLFANIPGYLLVSVMKVVNSSSHQDERTPKTSCGDNKHRSVSLQPHIDPWNPNTIKESSYKETNPSLPLPVSYLMEKGFDTIVCYSSIDWNFLKQRPQHIMSNFRDMGFRIIYIEPNKYRIKIDQEGLVYDANTISQLLRQQLPNLVREVEHNIFAVKPVEFIQGPRGKSLNVVNQSLEMVLGLFSLSKYISWVLLADWVPYLVLDRSRTFQVFDCVDDLTAFNPSPLTVSYEQLLLRTSDMVAVTSNTLRESKSPYTDSIFHIPNGVDPEFFKGLFREPDDLKSIPHPRIGYVGAVAGWVDLDLIHKSALERPDWSFVLVGPAFTDISSLNAPNIHILGSKPFEKLPAYYQHLDCGTVPFRVDHPAAYHSNPIKILEYFASGLPVISTPIPEAIRMSPPVTVSDPSEFVQGIQNVLSRGHKTHYFADEIVHFLSSLTWEHLTMTACSIIAAKIAASENRFELSRRILRAIIPAAYDKSSLHSEIRLYERMEHMCNVQKSNKTRVTDEWLEKVQIREKRPYCIMLFPDWTHPNGSWATVFQALIQLLADNDRITLAVRADPKQIPAPESILILSRLVSEVIEEEPEFCKNIVIVDNLLESNVLCRLLLSADAVLFSHENINSSHMQQVIEAAKVLGVKLLTINPKKPRKLDILRSK